MPSQNSNQLKTDNIMSDVKKPHQMCLFYRNNPLDDNADESQLKQAYEKFTIESGLTWKFNTFVSKYKSFARYVKKYPGVLKGASNKNHDERKTILREHISANKNKINDDLCDMREKSTGQDTWKPDWLMTRMEQTTKRYIEAEQLLDKLAEMPWYKRIFARNRINEFLEDTRWKYVF